MKSCFFMKISKSNQITWLVRSRGFALEIFFSKIWQFKKSKNVKVVGKKMGMEYFGRIFMVFTSVSSSDLNPNLFHSDVLTVNTNRSSLDVMWFDRFWVKKSQLQSLCPNLLPFLSYIASYIPPYV